MILIRRSKINSMIKIRELANLRKMHPEMNESVGWLNEHLGDLIEFRKELIIDDDFTSEEYFNTLKYIDLLEDEKYEELSEFKIQEI